MNNDANIPMETEILSRVDAVAAKLGVAATELWNIWLATSWTPLGKVTMAMTITTLFVLVLSAVTWHCAKRFAQTDGDGWLLAAVGCGFGAVFFCVILGLMLLTELPDAVIYWRFPELYALDQLRALIGR